LNANFAEYNLVKMLIINCLIIDDEPIARQGLQEYVAEIEFLQLIGQAENPLRATEFLNQQPIDLLFLDIEMPKINGIDFLKTLKKPPMVIFTTAYPDFALKGFELDILDYLLKPISFERFLKAVHKARDLKILQQQATDNQTVNQLDFFFVKCDNKFEKVFYNELLYVESLQNYVILHTQAKKIITYLTLKSLEDTLPENQFIKVHKSYLVALAKIEQIEGNQIIIQQQKIPISRILRESVMQKILQDKLLKR
jgi:DNA-binding LytR/AlgR family response regulator